MMEEKNETCPVAEYCLFYEKKFFYNSYETKFYMEKCLQGGGDCGLKRHHDISERLKRIENGNKKNN